MSLKYKKKKMRNTQNGTSQSAKKHLREKEKEEKKQYAVSEIQFRSLKRAALNRINKNFEQFLFPFKRHVAITVVDVNKSLV